MVMENPCNPWSKCFAAGEQSTSIAGQRKDAVEGFFAIFAIFVVKCGARFHCLVTALPRILPEGMSALTVR